VGAQKILRQKGVSVKSAGQTPAIPGRPFQYRKICLLFGTSVSVLIRYRAIGRLFRARFQGPRMRRRARPRFGRPGGRFVFSPILVFFPFPRLDGFCFIFLLVLIGESHIFLITGVLLKTEGDQAGQLRLRAALSERIWRRRTCLHAAYRL
jgi:hypothetical protein